MGYMVNGKVDMTLAKKQLHEYEGAETAPHILESCEHIQQKEIDEEENAFIIFKCFLNAAKELIRLRRPFLSGWKLYNKNI